MTDNLNPIAAKIHGALLTAIAEHDCEDIR